MTPRRPEIDPEPTRRVGSVGSVYDRNLEIEARKARALESCVNSLNGVGCALFAVAFAIAMISVAILWRVM